MGTASAERRCSHSVAELQHSVLLHGRVAVMSGHRWRKFRVAPAGTAVGAASNSSARYRWFCRSLAAWLGACFSALNLQARLEWVLLNRSVRSAQIFHMEIPQKPACLRRRDIILTAVKSADSVRIRHQLTYASQSPLPDRAFYFSARTFI
jgi:hypothetical protein